METIKIKADSSQMLSIFAGRDISLPWRYQPYLMIQIPFEEYVNFVRTLLNSPIAPFEFERELYIKHLSTYDATGFSVGLLQLYYCDISQAIINEYNLSVRRGKDATVITPYFNECEKTFYLSSISELYKFISEKEINTIQPYLNNYVLKPKNNILSKHNDSVLIYAIGLRALAMNKKGIFKLNVGGR